MAKNSTSRATEPDQDQDQITSQMVPRWTANESYRALLSGGVLIRGGPENYIYAMFDAMAPGTTFNHRWRMHATSNGSFYLVPGLPTKTVEMRGPWNGETVTLAAEGAGIAATLLALADMAMRPRCALASEAYHGLLAFAQQHPDGESICRLL